jgi:hypothetical protein
MSANKGKYFTVTTTQVVRANSITDAVTATQRKKVPNTSVLTAWTSTERIPAAQAHELAAEVS